MISVQLNSPMQHSTDILNFNQNSFNARNNNTMNTDGGVSGSSNAFVKPKFKPSKSSVDLTKQEYTQYYTMEGREQQRTFVSRMQKYLPEIDFKILFACLIWYLTSAVSSNLTKEVLKRFKHPITLTECQFFISTVFCVSTIAIINSFPQFYNTFPQGTLPPLNTKKSLYTLVRPTKALIITTLPMGIFQFVGHITSHKATSLVPVSIVHSIKALSPLTTVVFYKIFFKIEYPLITYLTLIPLMLGVILMTCGKTGTKGKSVKKVEEGSGSFNVGVIFAFISMIIFVSQNLFAKKILTWVPKSLPTASSSKSDQQPKFDKISILLYCSVFGFLLTLPVYLISELTSNSSFTLLQLNPTIISLLLIHGLTHFIQAMLAFYLIGEITTVNYSIANIMKRIVVITIALVWERESEINLWQGSGVICTLFGLYCYDKWGMLKKRKGISA